MNYSLPDVMIRPMVQQALQEDLGRRGDITSEAVIHHTCTAKLHIIAREAGILCGLDLARLCFNEMGAQFTTTVQDGMPIKKGTILATVEGQAYTLLSAERTALNFLTHLTGIATQTHQLQHQISHTKAKITCTRKTIPLLRVLQKYAVRVGGGRNHRMGLDDAILIKDNHIALSGGNIVQTIQQAKAYAGHLIPIEIEVDTLEQLKIILNEGVSLVLLDNMSTSQLTEAVELCRGHTQTEASGGLNPSNLVEVAQTGVDFLAMGYLTHSASYIDIGLDYL